jgi:hypothetical protein
MAGGIFISYRRDDSRHAAGRLVDRLAQTYDRDQLFMDVDAIEPGLDFLKVINEKVAACDVLLAVIGPTWLDARNQSGARRLDDPDDFVRLEIEAALKRDVRVIPVLVDGAEMPRAGELPERLQPIVRRNAVRLAHERFGADAESLVEALAKVVVPSSQGVGWFGMKARAGKGPQVPSQPRQAFAAAPSVPEQHTTGNRALFLFLFGLALAVGIGALTLLSFGVGVWWQENGFPHWWGPAAGSTGASLTAAVLLLMGMAWVRRYVRMPSATEKVMFAAAVAAGLAVVVFWSNVK